MRTCFATIGLGVLLAAPALGDVVHLTNGRRIEGKVVDERRGAVHVEVPGGRVVLPATAVDRIERRESPHEEYAARARATDMSDPAAVDALAAWASDRGLGDQAEHLRALARGLRLERRVAAVRGSRHAQDWIDVYRWSRAEGASLEVQRWLVERAAALDPEHPSVKAALRALEVDAAMSRSTGQAPAPARRRAPREAMSNDDARAAALEAELAQRELEERALRERLAQAEQQRRWRPRRRAPRVVQPAPTAPAEPLPATPSPRAGVPLHVPAPMPRAPQPPATPAAR